jgi:hypothetical protein
MHVEAVAKNFNPLPIALFLQNKLKGPGRVSSVKRGMF